MYFQSNQIKCFKNSYSYLSIDEGWKTAQINIFIFKAPKIKSMMI